MISKDEAIAKFKEIIGSQAKWLQILKSQFVNHLSIFQSWALRDALWKIERAKQEYFLSVALNRSSIIAHVEDREYLPRKPQPSNGLMQIVNNGDYPVSMPLEQLLMSSNSVYYITADPIVIASGGTKQVSVNQLEIVEIEHVVTEEKSFYEILINKDYTGQIHTFSVSADLQDGNGFETWDYSRLFHNADADAKVYDEFYSHTDQTGLRFGNDIFGKVLPVGAVVKIELKLTQGDTFLLEGQALYLVGELLDGNGGAANLAMASYESITEGSDGEGTEEIRRNLHYWPVYNERLIWDEDYTYFLKRQIPQIVWIKVWGENEAEEAAGSPDTGFINKIFVSAYAAGYTDLELETSAIGRLENIPKNLNRKYEWVTPAFSTFDLTVTGKVAKTANINQVKQDIEDILADNYGKDSSDRLQKVVGKDFYRLISATGYFPEPEKREKTNVPYFTVTHTGTIEPTDLNEMVYLNTITFDIGYL